MEHWNTTSTLPPTSEITDVQFDGIDHKDFPHYSDAYITSAKAFGCELMPEEIEELAKDETWFQKELWNFLSNCNDLPE